MSEKERLDMALVRRGLAESRERAQALIMAGLVFLKGQRADKASLSVLPEDAVEVRGAPHPYVSRGGLKLEKAMRVFPVDARNVVAMDVGASTGGFTDVLLRAGARRVYAIDVGYGQLDYKLRGDPRVTVMERTNARYLTPADFDEPPTLCVMDVSFISIKLILPQIRKLLSPGGHVVTLVKPQFEAGRAHVGKKGVVRDPAVHRMVLADLLAFIQKTGFSMQGADFSPITGPEGNIEFLLHLSTQPDEGIDINVDELIKSAYALHKI